MVKILTTEEAFRVVAGKNEILDTARHENITSTLELIGYIEKQVEQGLVIIEADLLINALAILAFEHASLDSLEVAMLDRIARDEDKVWEDRESLFDSE